MDLLNQQLTEDETNYRKTRNGVALFLVAAGAIGVLFMGERIVAIGNGPQNIPLIAKFLAFDATARKIIVPDGEIEVPEGAYFAVGTFLYLLALFIAGSLTKVLIVTGAGLLRVDVNRSADAARAKVR